MRFVDIKKSHLQGVDDKIIKKIVGHKGQSVTETVYTHFEIQELLGKSAKKHAGNQHICIDHNSHTRFFLLTNLTIPSTSFSS
jgi:hypothetical protein